MTIQARITAIDSAEAELRRLQTALGFAAGLLRRATTTPPSALYLATAEEELRRARSLAITAFQAVELATTDLGQP